MPAARPNTAASTAHTATGLAPRAARISRPISRRDPAVHRLALAWRDRTGGRARGQDLCRRTILACSGGGDSVGLALGLAAAVSNPRGIFIIAHIIHDLRPREEALADRDTVAALAKSLNLPFVESEIAVRAVGGNAESAARRLRYHALANLAAEHRCHFIATAHHAQDQFESLLMALLRGSGTRGLRGIAPSRVLPGSDIRLIRPALELDTHDLRRLCTQAGIDWAEDQTNRDTTRLRAALRHDIIPQLEQLRPGAAHRAARTASLMRAADALITQRTRDLLIAGRDGDSFEWKREHLRNESTIILGALLREASSHLTPRGTDKLTSRAINPIIRALRDRTTDPRTFSLATLTLTIDAHRARLSTP